LNLCEQRNRNIKEFTVTGLLIAVQDSRGFSGGNKIQETLHFWYKTNYLSIKHEFCFKIVRLVSQFFFWKLTLGDEILFLLDVTEEDQHDIYKKFVFEF
jgi:hypothetical protein